MAQYLASIWKCRYFWLALARTDLRARYRRSILGVGWSLLQPLAMTAVLCTVFHKLMGLDVREYAPSLLIGMSFWNFVTSATAEGCHCLFMSERYIRQHPAPVAIYPLRVALGTSFHFFVALMLTIPLTWCFNGIGNPLALVALVPTAALVFAFGWAIAVLAGFATAYFPDMQHLSQVGLQILFYGTPIIYPPHLLRQKGFGWVVDYNPLAAFIEILREPILSGHVSSLSTYAMVCGAVATISCAAVFVLVRLQRTIIFQL